MATFSPTAALGAGTTYVGLDQGRDGRGHGPRRQPPRGRPDLDLHGGRLDGTTTSYLSDLPYTVTANGWGLVEKDRSNGEDSANDGLPITLAGVVYPKGLGTHAAADIRYTMSGCTKFTAKVGVDDEVAVRGSVVLPGLGGRDQGAPTGHPERRQPDRDRSRHRHRQDAPSSWS